MPPVYMSNFSPSLVSVPSNSYTLGLSARSILIGRVNLPRGACGRGRYIGGYSGGNPHVDSGFVPKTYKLLERHRSCYKGLESAC